MAFSRLTLCCLAALSLGACSSFGAGAGRNHPALAADGVEPGASPYGLFLAGQAAVNDGHTGAAEAYFNRAAHTADEAKDGAPAQSLLNSRAFTSALLAGDIARAAAIAPRGADSEPALRHLGALVRGVEDLATGRAKAARAVLTSPDAGAPAEPAIALLTPFASAAAGDAAASIIHPVITDEPIAQFFANLDQGKLFERARRYDEAETAFRALIAKGDPGGIASLWLGEMLERRGRRAEAVAIYDSALANNKGDETLVAARARAAAGGAAPKESSIRQSAAEALIAPATALLIQKQDQIALAYLRLALCLDPSRDEGWMMVGDILAGSGDDAGARAAYVKAKPGSPQYVASRSKLAWSLQAAGDKDAALASARETVSASPADQDAAVTLADILRADDRFEDSVKVLDGVIATQGIRPDWRLLYMRAVDHQGMGELDQAEADVQRALRIKPDDPELLNFLGYSWIDRGEKLPQALAMVQKAVSLKPRSGAMIDSLGWGYYRMGNYPLAVQKLEAAVVLEPADPDVNNHLGDAYWRAGRKTEAVFQWRRVLTLDPPAKLRTEVETKLRAGLGGANVPVVVTGS